MGKKLFHQKLVDPRIQFVGQQFLETPELQLFLYSEKQLREYAASGKFGKLREHLDQRQENIAWLNLHGVHDVELVNQIAQYFNLDKLVVQDLVDTTQRPKIEIHSDYLFFSIKSLSPLNHQKMEVEQISFILTKGILISFQEKKGDHFEHIRKRLREKLGTVREQGADYLLYLLIDAITGNYFNTLNNLEALLDMLPVEVTKDPRPGFISTIEDVKRNLFTIRKSVFPLKEAIFFTEKVPQSFISPPVNRYFSDLKDQLLQLFDEADLNLSRAEGITNLFFSYQGHRMNEVMKVLTLVATIFIPLTFIAGIYGMNFQYMPELSWKWGYFFVWGFMLLCFAGMILFFKRKKWL